MKQIIYLINIIIITISLVFSGEAILSTKTVLLSKSDNKPNIILSIKSEEDIYGIQFDVKYNVSELNLLEDAVISILPDAKIYADIKDDGIAQVIIFGLDGKKLIDVTADSIADFISINFIPKGKFRGISVVELYNITLAGKLGIEIDLNSSSIYAFEVSFVQPQNTYLSKNIPDPFNTTTTIEYAVSEPGIVSLIIFDLQGAVVKILVNEHHEENYYSITWNGLSQSGDELASGKYILNMSTINFLDTITLTRIK